jgi:hypothetical protein
MNPLDIFTSPALGDFMGAVLVTVVLAWCLVDALRRWGIGAALVVALLAAGVLSAMAVRTGMLGPADLAVPVIIVFCIVCWWIALKRKRKPTPPPPPTE